MEFEVLVKKLKRLKDLSRFYKYDKSYVHHIKQIKKEIKKRESD